MPQLLVTGGLAKRDVERTLRQLALARCDLSSPVTLVVRVDHDGAVAQALALTDDSCVAAHVRLLHFPRASARTTIVVTLER